MFRLCWLLLMAPDAHFEVRDGKPVAGEVLGLEKLVLKTPYGTLKVPIVELGTLRFDGAAASAYTTAGEIRGQLELDHFEILTRFGKLKIEVKNLARVKLLGPEAQWTESPGVLLANGTRLDGRLLLDKVPLATRYGTLTIPVDRIEGMWRGEAGFHYVRAGGDVFRGKLPDRVWTLSTRFGALRFETSALQRMWSQTLPTEGTILDGGHEVVAVERFRGHTYLLVTHPRGTDWNDAQRVARGLSGHVATVGDREENDFLVELARRGHPTWSCWIGFTDAAREGTWAWVTGEPPDFTNWDGGEPNNANDEDGVEMRMDRDGRWNDVRLSQRNMGGCLIELER